MRYLLLFILFLLFPFSADAHEAVVKGFSSGLKHPVLGLDHLLAMVSVGIISVQIGGRAVWTIPSAFVLSMVFGGVLGMNGFYLGAIETGIAFSVFCLGLVIAMTKKIPDFLIYGFVALFGIFHGFAHGLEIPTLATSWSYIAGFMIGTASLHALGVLIGFAAKKINHGTVILRYSGAFIAGIGFHILLGI